MSSLNRKRWELVSQGRFDEAVELLHRAAEATPGDHQAWVLLGTEYTRLSRWDAAIDAFRRALALEPDDGPTLMRLGICLASSGDPLSAQETYEQAIRLGARDAILMKRYRSAFLKTERFAEAADLLAETYNESAIHDVGMTLALALERSQRSEQAVEVLEDVLRTSPHSQEALLALGTIHLRSGKHEQAAEALEAAAEHDSGNLDVHLALADTYVAMRRFDDAIAVLERVMPERPNTAAIWERCATAYATAGRAEQARECSARAAEIATRMEKALEVIGAAPAFDTRWELVDHCLEARPQEGLVLEFGVAAGMSVRYIGGRVPGTVYGFDSFEGLPHGSDAWTKGQFAQEALPAVPSNVELVVGWYDETLEGFLAEHDEPVSLIHVDCDLYVSTKYVLERLGDRLVSGSVILFDELWPLGGPENHEWRALDETLLAGGVELRFTGRVRAGPQVAVQIA